MVEVFFPTRQECRVPVGGGARLVVTIEMVDGVPKVTWSPDLGVERVFGCWGRRGLDGTARPESAPEAGTAERSETAEGRGTGLGSAETARGTVWEVVTEESKGSYRFFKVVVEMP